MTHDPSSGIPLRSKGAVRFARYCVEMRRTNNELAEVLGFSDGTAVSHLRHGRRLPNLERAVAIQDLTASWDEGPIAPGEWLVAAERGTGHDHTSEADGEAGT